MGKKNSPSKRDGPGLTGQAGFSQPSSARKTFLFSVSGVMRFLRDIGTSLTQFREATIINEQLS